MIIATPFFSSQQFGYDAQRDVYICPAGKELHFSKLQTTERSRRYRARAKDCNHCPLKEQCTTSTQGRSLCRSVDEEVLDRVRAYSTTQAYKKAYRKRSVWVEPLFAEGKQWHGMRRFRLRRLWRVNCEALMRAAGQNLKRLLKKRGWGWRPWPTGAAHALMEPSPQDGIHLYAPQLPEKALACGEQLRVKDLVKPLPVLSMPLVFAFWLSLACLWLFRYVVLAKAGHR